MLSPYGQLFLWSITMQMDMLAIVWDNLLIVRSWIQYNAMHALKLDDVYLVIILNYVIWAWM
jgi:hypothetical protein